MPGVGKPTAVLLYGIPKMAFSISNTLVITTMVVMVVIGAGMAEWGAIMNSGETWKHPANTTGRGGIQHEKLVEPFGIPTTLESEILGTQLTVTGAFRLD